MTSEGESQGMKAAVKGSPSAVSRRLFVWVGSIAMVVYIAAIGIFAIEEINSREATARLLAARQAEVLNLLTSREEAAKGDKPGAVVTAPPASTNDGGVAGKGQLEHERKRLGELQTRLAILVTDGSGALGSPATVKAILCEFDKIDEDAPSCPAPDEPVSTSDKVIAFLSNFFLKNLAARSGTGNILAVLIVTAALGGALIRLSLDSENDILRTCLRAMGGGIVCYLVVVGGGVPLATLNLQKPASPATATLFGLLSGMFSNKLFQLVSDFVDAFVRKVTPADPSDEAASADTATEGAPEGATSPKALHNGGAVASPEVPSVAVAGASASGGLAPKV